MLETQRLAALASLPPGRHRFDHAPAALTGPAMGAPVTTSLVDDARWWTVTMAFQQAVDWVWAHPPAGLTYSGSAGFGAGATIRGYAYAERDTRFWTYAQLEISVAPAGPNSSYLRIDGVAEWLDPRPVRDGESGHRIHVTTAVDCPRSDRGVAGVTNSGPGLDDALLPFGRPTRAFACRYSRLKAPMSILRGTRTLSAAQATRLASAARAVALSHADGEVIACPSGDGSADVIAFAYPGRTVDLWYTDFGCRAVANGTISTANGSIGPFAEAVQPLLS